MKSFMDVPPGFRGGSQSCHGLDRLFLGWNRMGGCHQRKMPPTPAQGSGVGEKGWSGTCKARVSSNSSDLHACPSSRDGQGPEQVARNLPSWLRAVLDLRVHLRSQPVWPPSAAPFTMWWWLSSEDQHAGKLGPSVTAVELWLIG